MEDEREPTQRTPKGAKRERLGLPGEGGLEIPVPTRDQVYGDLEKVARPEAKRKKKRRRA